MHARMPYYVEIKLIQLAILSLEMVKEWVKVNYLMKAQQDIQYQSSSYTVGAKGTRE